MPFVVVGDLHGTRLEIAAGSARAAAAAARYWHTEFGAIVWWGVREHTPDPPMFMLGRWLGLGPGHADGTSHAFPLTPGRFVLSEPAAYCGVRMPQEQMDLCGPWHGLPCGVCRTTVSQIYAARPGSPR